MTDSFWKQEILVEEVPKKRTEVYRISLVQSKSDSWLVSIREWYLGEDEEMHPGKGGLSIPSGPLEDVVKALGKAVKQYKELEK